MSQVIVGRRYAAALLSDASCEAEARALGSALRVAVEVLSDPTARSALTNPAISDEDRKGVLSELGKAMDLPKTLARFLEVLLEAGRISALGEVATAYQRLFEDRFKIRKAVVQTAQPMDEKLANTLVEKLEKITGDRIELEFVEAPELLAGWRARVGNQLIEADLVSQVDRLRDRVVKG